MAVRHEAPEGHCLPSRRREPGRDGLCREGGEVGDDDVWVQGDEPVLQSTQPDHSLDPKFCFSTTSHISHLGLRLQGRSLPAQLMQSYLPALILCV